MDLKSYSATKTLESSLTNDQDKCAICLEIYKEPTHLPCRHPFCAKPCLQNILDSSQDNTFRCPLCRQKYHVETFACAPETSVVVIPAVTQTEPSVVLPILVHTPEHRMCSFLRNECSQMMYGICILVAVIHFCLVSITRIVLGVYYWTSATMLPTCHIGKGIFDLSIALVMCCSLEGCVLVFLCSSVIVTVFGTIEAWQTDSFDKFANVDFLASSTRYYSFVDWAMLVFLIIYIFKTYRHQRDQ